MTLLDILPLKITGSKEEVMEQFQKVKELSDEDRKTFLKFDLYQLNNNISKGFEVVSFKFNFYRFISEYINPLIEDLLENGLDDFKIYETFNNLLNEPQIGYFNGNPISVVNIFGTDMEKTLFKYYYLIKDYVYSGNMNVVSQYEQSMYPLKIRGTKEENIEVLRQIPETDNKLIEETIKKGLLVEFSGERISKGFQEAMGEFILYHRFIKKQFDGQYTCDDRTLYKVGKGFKDGDGLLFYTSAPFFCTESSINTIGSSSKKKQWIKYVKDCELSKKLFQKKLLNIKEFIKKYYK